MSHSSLLFNIFYHFTFPGFPFILILGNRLSHKDAKRKTGGIGSLRRNWEYGHYAQNHPFSGGGLRNKCHFFKLCLRRKAYKVKRLRRLISDEVFIYS